MHVEVLSALLCLVATAYAGCPLGFHQNRRSCYWFSTIRSSFAEAAGYCRYLESHLAIISNKDEDSFIRGYATRLGEAFNYWLGASDLNMEGRWLWEGQRRMNYTNWNPGQPDNAGGIEHCLELRRDLGNYLWNDYQCQKPSHFICEKERIPYTNSLHANLQQMDSLHANLQQRDSLHANLQQMDSLHANLQQRDSLHANLQQRDSLHGNL
uniref:Perlucin B protein n=1 Tax=Haliotis laevigata TaxID=36097 RepID=F8J3D1_HALLA|nr:perlucin B protein precursor [Haliotis laevigata]